MFLMNRQADTPCLPFPVHIRCILAHRGLETQSKLTEHDLLCTSSVGQIDRPRSCPRIFVRGMIRNDPIEYRISTVRSGHA